MENNSRKNLYKQAGKDASEIQDTMKERLFSYQGRQRERLLTVKRLKIDSLEEAGQRLTAEEEQAQMKQLIAALKSGDKVEALNKLHHSFARDSNNAGLFLRCEGFPLLQSCLLSTDSNLLHTAAWCAINLSAAVESSQTDKVLRLSPLLIQFLPGSDCVMQELCAWAVGNLAGGGQKSKETLLQQGVVPLLLSLVPTTHNPMFEARTQSALFALINLARDTTHRCLRCMQENSSFDLIKGLLQNTPETSKLCLEIGWLVNYTYSRPEMYLQYRDQYESILHLVLQKLTLLTQLQPGSWKDQVIEPYLLCCGNTVGLSQDLALLAGDLASFLPAMTLCLECQSSIVQADALWALVNFSAEVTCRILVLGHPKLLSSVQSLCSSREPNITEQVLNLLETLSRTSGAVNKFLVQKGVVQSMSELLRSLPFHSSPDTIKRILLVIEDLFFEEPGKEVSQCLLKPLQHLASHSFDDTLVKRVNSLIEHLS